MPAKPIAAMELGVPAAPTGTHKPTDTIASSLLRDSAASKSGEPRLRGRVAAGEDAVGAAAVPRQQVFATLDPDPLAEQLAKQRQLAAAELVTEGRRLGDRTMVFHQFQRPILDGPAL